MQHGRKEAKIKKIFWELLYFPLHLKSELYNLIIIDMMLLNGVDIYMENGLKLGTVLK